MKGEQPLAHFCGCANKLPAEHADVPFQGAIAAKKKPADEPVEPVFR